MTEHITVPFKQVDVFTSKLFKGNPLAVINLLDHDENEFTYEKLQAIANWTNLSETTFLFRPSDATIADYKVRIFTPSSELPFAGHPTLGSCKAFIEFTKCPKKTIVQECKGGLITITAKENLLSFEAVLTDIEEIPTEAVEKYETCLGISPIARPKLLNVGPKWVVYLLKDAETCYEANINYTALAKVSEEFGHEGIIMAGQKPGEPEQYEMRAFAPADGVNEDPVCGSGSVALSRFLQDHFNFESTFSFHISQGGRLQREGNIEAVIEHSDGKIRYNVGGDTLTIVNGTMNL